MEKYDVVVIGAGPGGYVAAIRAAQNGLKTAIVEKQWMGGVCLNVGCIPSKALLKNAAVADLLRNGAKEFGFSVDHLSLDYSAAVQRSRKVSARLVKGIGFLMKKNNIDTVMGTATFKSADAIDVTAEDGSVQTLEARHFIIATGAHSLVLPWMGMDGEKVVTYTEAILQEKLPASAIIIGGGAIGCEFATVWNSYGSDVTIVEMLPNILPTEDEEASKELAKHFKKAKIDVKAGHRVEKIEKTAAGVAVTVSSEKGEEVLEAEQALVAIGFRPNTEGIGLEKAGVKLNERGFIAVDETMKTSVKNIYAIGDVTGNLLLAHAASAMGILAADAIAGKSTKPIHFRSIPRATYSHPQVASFGMNEQEAIDAGLDVKVGRFNFMANGKALGLGEGAGWVKVIVDAKLGEVLGAAMVGPEVSELLPELVLANSAELTIEEIANTVHAHPTLSEAIMEAAHDALGHAIHS
ncbi:MAG: dihydrolipoyl dehydrogenase [Anaerolineae bacterium]|jgi:dihydrolipoamide dehydrogenase|nr:dihydrolipoyl dehydrogenase [Anaerolineae bacterium]